MYLAAPKQKTVAIEYNFELKLQHAWVKCMAKADLFFLLNFLNAHGGRRVRQKAEKQQIWGLFLQTFLRGSAVLHAEIISLVKLNPQLV